MPLAVKSLSRSFKYGSATLLDPDPTKTPDQVREHYAEIYHELTNSEIKGPITGADFVEYTFVPSIGSKG